MIDRVKIRRYEFDAGSNRTAKKTYAPGTGSMTATYYANDLARSITQDGKTQTLELDPMLRALTKTKSGGWSGTQTYAYSNDSDSPAFLAEGSSWTRWIAGLDGSVDATQKSDGTLAWTVSNIRGDMIAEAGGAGLMNVREIDEFGNAEGGLPSSRPYGFHGSKERETLTDGGTIAMGVRLYVPGSGRFLQTDPVLGGTANPYEYPSDPVNSNDLNGFRAKKKKAATKCWVDGTNIREAAGSETLEVQIGVAVRCNGTASKINLTSRIVSGRTSAGIVTRGVNKGKTCKLTGKCVVTPHTTITLWPTCNGAYVADFVVGITGSWVGLDGKRHSITYRETFAATQIVCSRGSGRI